MHKAGEPLLLVITQLATTLHSAQKNKSAIYAKHFQTISHEEIKKSIRNDTRFISEWIQFTEDKRWTPAWGGGMDYCVTFDNPIDACAFMIGMEMEELRIKRVK